MSFKCIVFLYVIKYIIVNDCFVICVGSSLLSKNSGCDNGIPWNAFAKPKIPMEVDILDEDTLNAEVPQGNPNMPDGTQTEDAEMITLDMDEVKSLVNTESATATTSAEYFIMSKDGTKTAAGGPRGYRPEHPFKPPCATASAGRSSNTVTTATGTACSATAINSL